MADKTRYTANLVSDSNIYSDITNDRVGIGTTVPTSKLTVVGDVRVSGVVTASSFSGNASLSQLNVTGFSTLSSASAANLTLVGVTTGLNVPGISTFGDVIISDLFLSGITTGLNSPGISTFGDVTISDLFLAGITTGLNVSGVSTLSSAVVGSAVTINGGGINVTGVVTASSFSGNASTATALQTARTFEITGDIVASPISFNGTGNVSLAATIQPNSVGLGTDTTGDYVANITGTSNQITVTSGTGEGSTPTLSLPSNLVVPQDLTVTRDLQVNRNLNVTGNITIGGTSATLFTTELKVADPDLVLGFRTDGSGNDVSNDTTANHGGIAVASTEGNPLISLYNPGIGESTLATYKKIMWFKSGSFTGLNTDAWLINYAVGIGSTQFPTGTRFAAGNVQFTQNDLAVVRNINASGIVTALSFSGNASISQLNVSGFSTLSSISAANLTLAGITTGLNVPGISTLGFITSSSLNVSGFSTLSSISAANLTLAGVTTGLNVPGISTLGSVSNTNLSVSGVSTFSGGVNASQGADLARLRVTGITTLGFITATSLNVPGISTLGFITSSSLNVSGVSTFSGGISGSEGADLSRLRVTGITTLGQTNTTGFSNAGLSTLGNATASTLVVSGFSTLSSVSAANLTLAGVTTGLNVPGISTLGFVQNTTLNVTGVSTFSGGINGSEGVDLARLRVTGITTLGFITATSLNVPGISTLGFITSSSLNVSGVSTFSGGISGSEGADLSRLRVTGISTLGQTNTTGFSNTGLSTLGNATASTLVVSGFSTLSSVSAANLTLAGVTTGLNAPGISTLGFVQHTTLNVSGFSTLGSISGANLTLAGVTTGLNASGVVTATSFSGSGANLTSLNATQLTTGTVPAARITASSGDFTVGSNLYVNGILSVGGTTVILNVQQLQISDRDITLGVTTDANGVDISTDNTANHGGISVASTVGTPLINIPTDAVNNSPSTYKQIMWVKQGHYTGLATDAWIFNYGVSIGNTSTVQNGSRLTVGAGFTVYDNYLDAQDIRGRNLNIVGVSTLGTASASSLSVSGTSSFIGGISGSEGADLGRLRVTGIATLGQTNTTGFSNAGVSTLGNATASTLVVSGFSTLGITSATNLTAQQLNISGVSTFGGNLIPSSSSVNIGGISNRFGVGYWSDGSHYYGTNKLFVSSGSGFGLEAYVSNAAYLLSNAGGGSSGNVYIDTVVGGKVIAYGSGSVQVLHSQNVKLQTSGVGVTVTGITQTDNLSVGTGGTVITTTSSGLVGIGTTNPTSKLHVVGSALITGVSTIANFSITPVGTGATVGGIGVTYYGDGSQLTGISASGGVSISTNTTNANQYIPYATSFGSTTGFGATTLLVYNPSSGNLGIGTTNPTSSLTVQGSTRITGITSIRDVTIDKSIASPNATVPVAIIGVTTSGISTETNIDVVLLAKGTGATLAQVPDGTVAGGDKRGTGATDWQKSRTAAARVASGAYATITGGSENTASGTYAIAGGYLNTVSGSYATVAGGQNNQASGSHNSALGGYNNNASGTIRATIAGGDSNTASSNYSFVGGGLNNTAQTNTHATVCGGQSNTASGQNAFVGGGGSNNATAAYAFIGGGFSNTASTGTAPTVAGGNNNNASGNYAFIGGGEAHIANANHSVVLGGNAGTVRSIVGNFVFPACAQPISATQGVTQSALLLLARQTTNATATVLTSDQSAASTTNQVILANNAAYFFKGSCIAGVTGAGDTKAWEFKGAIKRGANAAATSIVGSVIKDVIASDSGASAWDITITADTTNGGIAVTVTGQASTTIRWVCKIETTEMTY